MTAGSANENLSITVGDRTLTLTPDSDGFSTLHLWIDGSVIETFVDRKQVITTRSYAAPNESGEIQLAWSGPASAIDSLAVSSISPVSKDRLTT
jgi:sucrose-6-phosphate hydrolase SacC (GH32 family)